MGEAFLSSALVFSRLGEIERLVVEEVVLLPLGHLHQGADGRPGDGRAPESKRGHRRLGVGVGEQPVEKKIGDIIFRSQATEKRPNKVTFRLSDFCPIGGSPKTILS